MRTGLNAASYRDDVRRLGRERGSFGSPTTQSFRFMAGGAMALALLVGCYTTTFTPASRPRQYTGDGGTAHQINGVEIWTFGAPDRPFEIIGWLEDQRHTGLISRQTFEPDVAAAAKKAGGDGVILQHSDTQLRGYAVGSGYAVPMNDKTSHLAVFRYLPAPK